MMAYRKRAEVPFNIDEAVRLYRTGQSMALVAQNLNVTFGLILYWFTKLKIRRRSRNSYRTVNRRSQLKIRAARNRKIKAMRRKPEKLEYIALMFGLTTQQVSHICRGIVRRPTADP